MSAELLDLFAEYRKNLRETSPDENQRVLIYSINRHSILPGHSVVGGLADRLKGITTAFSLAFLTGRRFLIDWEEPFPLTGHLSPAHYDWRTIRFRRFIVSSHCFRHLDFIDRSEILESLSIDELDEKLFGREKLVIMNINSSRLKLIRMNMKEKYKLNVGDGHLFRGVFSFLFSYEIPAAFRQADDRMKKMRSEADLVLGVHLRTGDGNGWRDPALDDWRNFELIMQHAIDEAKRQGARAPAFYFVSDSSQAREAVRAANWPYPVHVDIEEISHIDRSVDANERSNHLTFFEFLNLAKCDRLICGYGGFAPVAAMVGARPYSRYYT